MWNFFKTKNEEDKNYIKEYLNDITNFRKQNGISVFIIVFGFAAIIIFQVFDISKDILKALIPLIYIVVIGGFAVLIINLIFIKKILLDLSARIRTHYNEITQEYIKQIIIELRNTKNLDSAYEDSINKIDIAILKEQKSMYSLINKLENKEEN